MLLCNERDFKYVGHDALFIYNAVRSQRFRNKWVGEISGPAVKAAGFCITGDNLGSHDTGELIEHFSTSNYCCRYCLAIRG
jgi:hypothetical protein